jgi:hypothetical protein
METRPQLTLMNYECRMGTQVQSLYTRSPRQEITQSPAICSNSNVQNPTSNDQAHLFTLLNEHTDWLTLDIGLWTLDL